MPQVDEGELSDPEVEIIRVPLVRPVSPRRDLQAFFAVRDLITRHQPDIVHTHMAKAGAITRVAVDRVSPRPRIVHTFHGHVLEAYFRPTVQRTFLTIERRLATRSDALIAVSPQVRDSLLALGIGTPEQWRVIPLGFDLSGLLSIEHPGGELRRRIGVHAEAFLIGVLGRLAPVKDHSTLLQALARTSDIHLVVLGDGELRSNLERETRALNIHSRVHFAGWWADVAAAISDLDVVVLSSLNEGTPVSLIEGSAACKPVVATDVGGVRTVVVEGRSGLIVPPRSPEALADALERLRDDSYLRARLGRAGRQYVAPRFSKDRLLADIRSLYDELLDEVG